MAFTKNCPICREKQTYTRYDSLLRASSKNSICYSCARKSAGDKYTVNKDTGCWEWNGYLNRGGYGQIKSKGRTFRAHRIYYEHIKGVIPANMEIDHLCRNRRCVNPDHLEAVASEINTQRGLLTKLSAVDVKRIRMELNDVDSRTLKDIALAYGIKVGTVSAIKCKRSWKNV